MKTKQWFLLLILPFLLKVCIVYASYEERRYLEDLIDSKENEDLNQWVEETEKELLDSTLNIERKIQLHELLAHAYFYLERWQQLKNHALDCIRIGIDGKLKSHIKGLNLLSIYYSALTDVTDQIHHKLEYSYKSRATSQRALVLLDCGVDPLTQAEVYFHAATLLSDQLFQAVDYYQKAMDLFEKENQMNGYLKAKIQLAKVYFQLKAFDKAERLIEEMQGTDMQKRTLAHFHMVEAELLKELGKERDALIMANFALSIAKQLHMQKHVEQIEGLIHTL